jgi:hypothetical protein
MNSRESDHRDYRTRREVVTRGPKPLDMVGIETLTEPLFPWEGESPAQCQRHDPRTDLSPQSRSQSRQSGAGDGTS